MFRLRCPRDRATLARLFSAQLFIDIKRMDGIGRSANRYILCFICRAHQVRRSRELTLLVVNITKSTFHQLSMLRRRFIIRSEIMQRFIGPVLHACTLCPSQFDTFQKLQAHRYRRHPQAAAGGCVLVYF